MSFIRFNDARIGLLTVLGLLDPENGGTKLIEEICSYFPVDTAPQPKNFESFNVTDVRNSNLTHAYQFCFEFHAAIPTHYFTHSNTPLRIGVKKFSNHTEATSISKHQKGDMKQVPY